jgi:transmembrane sensor
MNITKIIDRIITGNSSPGDEQILINWLNNSHENKDKFATRDKLCTAMDILLTRHKHDPDRAFNKFKSKIHLHRKKLSQPVSIRRIIFNSMKWAAFVLFFLFLGSGIFYLIGDTIFPGDYKINQVIVPVGSRSNLILADGTSVWVNAGSKINYASDFGKDSRDIYLEGEAFFDVVNDHAHPFTVTTSQIEIIALGTSFNVKSYPEENLIQTTLVSGSLIINRTMHKSTEKGVILEPFQQITYYKDSRELFLTDDLTGQPDQDEPVAGKASSKQDLPRIKLTRGINPDIFTSWKDNILILDDEPLESIVVKMERRFGPRIIIKDEELKGKRFKGSFEETTMEQALNALKFASPFEYKIDNDTVFITKKH